MHFTKLQGCGNDYIYVDCFAHTPPHEPEMLSRRISDRHFGIGADGLILILPSQVADARMRMFNADGSEGEMCGNGIRCVAKYVYDHGIAHKTPLTVETGRGVLTLDIISSKQRESWIRVDMGEPILESERIPTTIPAKNVIDHPAQRFDRRRLGAYRLEEDGIAPNMTCVSMGNPHLVFFLGGLHDLTAFPLEEFGPQWENNPAFPQRINVHIAQVVTQDEVRLRTWERGSGITLACGTGACAVAVAGSLTGRTGRRVMAHLPGGDLELDWSETDNHVYMTGPAVEVFSGEWPE